MFQKKYKSLNNRKRRSHHKTYRNFEIFKVEDSVKLSIRLTCAEGPAEKIFGGGTRAVLAIVSMPPIGSISAYPLTRRC